MASSGQIEEIRKDPGEAGRWEIAEFLAGFARSGELAQPMAGDTEEETWVRRLRWWWTENPFSRNDQPLALLLRGEGGNLVGFMGFIPHDYLLDGRVVTGLNATAFFVRETHRGQAMGMFLRSEKIARSHLILDGTPSPEMRRLLLRFGYQHPPTRVKFLYVARHPVSRLKHCFLRPTAMMLGNRGRDLHQAGLLCINHPGEIRSVPEVSDHRLRKAVTLEGLLWMSRIGSQQRDFLGVVDHEGKLVAYSIGLRKSAAGITVSRMMDYASFDESLCPVADLLSHAARRPALAGLSREVDFLLWSIIGESGLPSHFPRIRLKNHLHHKIPAAWGTPEKICVPAEGDYAML